MNENALRWQGRIGSLKTVAAVVAAIAVLVMIFLASQLPEALATRGQPRAITVAQLVNHEIGSGQYVSVDGTAFYNIGYNETEDGRPVSDYYFLVDSAAEYTILIKSAELISGEPEPQDVTIAGMTRTTGTDLHDLVAKDLADITEAGLATNLDLYLAEGESPLDLSLSVVSLAGLGMLVLVCLPVLFLPSTVFAARPVDVAATTTASGEAGTKVRGRFQQLKQVQPEIQVGKGTRTFNDAVANIIPLAPRHLLIFIRHILTTRAYGAKISETETHWGVFVTGANVIAVEPGMLYGWRERHAVRLRYKDERERPQSLIVSFNHAAAQAAFVNTLRQMGFVLGAFDSP